jgi:hypothetical protein
MFNAFYYDCWAYLTIDHGVSPYMTYYDSDAGIIAYGDINANVMT